MLACTVADDLVGRFPTCNGRGLLAVEGEISVWEVPAVAVDGNSGMLAIETGREPDVRLGVCPLLPAVWKAEAPI